MFFALVSLTLTLELIKSTALAQPTPKASHDDLLWLENSQVKVGLKPSSGGAIAWISPANSQKNLINTYDRGRLVQQSWYGRNDDSLWNDKPWSWNPVQAGDWRGRSATILEQRLDQTSIFTRTRPVHWATGEDLKECEMQQTVSLEQSLIHVRYQFVHKGEVSHPGRHQELPAFFVDASLDTLVMYDGEEAWSDGPLSRRQPDFPNEYGRMTEHWAAFVDSRDWGIGLFVPTVDEATFYRFPEKKARSKASDASWCSYIAPIRTLAITPMFRYSYDVWITVGSLDEIRQRFKKLAKDH